MIDYAYYLEHGSTKKHIAGFIKHKYKKEHDWSYYAFISVFISGFLYALPSIISILRG